MSAPQKVTPSIPVSIAIAIAAAVLVALAGRLP